MTWPESAAPPDRPGVWPRANRYDWSLGVAEAPQEAVRAALPAFPRAYLLIVNTPDECVIGGDAAAVAGLVASLGCRFFPLQGVTTVHCEVAQPVAEPYHDLHLFPTEPPAGITYYSGVKGGPYEVTRESAAGSILGQALHGIDYPAVIESAYLNGVRLFLEMGPGASCSRMIGRILGERPHLARSACYGAQDAVSTLLRLLGSLIAERIPVDLAPLSNQAAPDLDTTTSTSAVHVAIGGAPFQPPLPPAAPKNHLQLPPQPSALSHRERGRNIATDMLLGQFVQVQQEQIKAHEAYLSFSDSLTQAMARAMSLEMTLRQALGDDALVTRRLRLPPGQLRGLIAFDRDLCLEFAIGSVARMLGPQFAEADSFPTRVRLPDEPLMLVDRIISVEGEPRSMTHGRVVTEHDIHPGAWYLDGGRIPTCIAVEAGQADLFLSGYLGIDFITRGLAVYRLLDAVVTFHRGLPGPGETIHYDIRIERFFRQGDTWLFRFFFEATVDGEPLLTMRDGCAGFFSQQELDAGKGIVRPAVDLRPTTGIRPADWQELVPMAREGYRRGSAGPAARGRPGRLFRPALRRPADLTRPLTIPGGRMHLVHRVIEIDPDGGRCGSASSGPRPTSIPTTGSSPAISWTTGSCPAP